MTAEFAAVKTVLIKINVCFLKIWPHANIVTPNLALPYFPKLKDSSVLFTLCPIH